jgi:nitroimidazol reductase NimA-like FMN-containing flavoprotein (pyridoxamine 5'-phosphate oxidase superfamily)
MRRADKAMADEPEMLDLIRSQRLLTCAMCDNGEPYLVTVDYGYDEGARTFYVHCASEGKKLELLRANPIVWGQVVEDLGYIDGECDHAYRSVHFRGRAEVLADEGAKRAALRLMMRQLESGVTDERWAEFEAKPLDEVVVLAIRVEHMTGKRSLPRAK